MDDTAGPVPRLVVGISRSRASWWALAWAAGEARRRGARLLVLHVFRPRLVYPLPDPRYAGVRDDPYADRMAAGNRLIWTAISEALGQMPRDISVEEAIVPGRAAVELAHIARGGDVLVLGARHRGLLRRLAPGSVARACSRRAECPVVIVPEPSPRALAAALPADARSRWHWWPPHREIRMIS
jgi:nucleotide-binding universal stress UspA family protein